MPDGRELRVSVRILDVPASADAVYSYILRDAPDSDVSGYLADVPFGRGDRPMRALVTGTDESGGDRKLKTAVLRRDLPRVAREEAEFAGYISETALCTFGEALRLTSPYLEPERPNTVEYVSLTSGAEAPPERAKKQRELYARIAELSQNGAVSWSELRGYGFTRAVLSALAEKGCVRIESEERYRVPYGFSGGEKTRYSLSPEQTAAYETLKGLSETGKPACALLFGVTGSGKTAVLAELCRSVVEGGRSAVILVPEIALTKQTLDSFRRCFGDDIAVIHSGLTPGERFDEYTRLSRGEAHIALGTRSAIFAPVKNLGLIVIDEEQEHTYKSEQSPHYHARDMARYRAAKSNALLVLSSATPSVESFYRAKTGRYTLVRLDGRYGEAKLPETVFGDMRGEEPLAAGDGGVPDDRLPVVGSRLFGELEKTLSEKKQAILFVGRRGYNNFLSCTDCGSSVKCPHCSVTMTYHREAGGDLLLCHYCGTRRSVPSVCPECGSRHIKYRGYGTQYAADEIKKLFPEAVISRLDADTAPDRSSAEKILSDFREGLSDVLIGTQMVTKGHDFPNVTLSAVLAADASLFLGDYRANEKTFSLITQVAGRAGRGSDPGVAVIQTYNPEAEILDLAASGKYESFYDSEICIRKAFLFPPFCDICAVGFSAESEDGASKAAQFFASAFRDAADGKKDVPYSFFGPFEDIIYKVKDRYRRRCIIKFKNNGASRAALRSAYIETLKKHGKKCAVTVDINPDRV
ncbi:MAG: primosomal protein N' [Clostridia bacterium]|nr:primosomal protein N' [Clostridia bacterium]